MAQEIEPVSGTEVDLHRGGVPEWYVPPAMSVRPAWTDLHTPYRDDSKLGKFYHHAMLPFRAMALGFLWVSHPDNLVPVLFCFAMFIGIVLLIILR
jgi:hypothetical protein